MFDEYKSTERQQRNMKIRA